MLNNSYATLPSFLFETSFPPHYFTHFAPESLPHLPPHDAAKGVLPLLIYLKVYCRTEFYLEASRISHHMTLQHGPQIHSQFIHSCGLDRFQLGWCQVTGGPVYVFVCVVCVCVCSNSLFTRAAWIAFSWAVVKSREVLCMCVCVCVSSNPA